MNLLKVSTSLILLLICQVPGQPAQEEAEPRPLLSSDGLLQAPFQDGEEVWYEVHWQPLFFLPTMNAGEIHLRLEEAEMQGKKTFRIKGWAESTGAVAKAAGFDIRNYYESIIDRTDFRSYHFIEQIRQGQRQRDLDLRFDYTRDRTIVKETDPSKDPVRVLRDRSYPGMPAPAVDVLSAFYVARLHKPSPGQRFLMHLNERGRFKRVQIEALNWETVDTPVGEFNCIKLSTKGGIFREGGNFRIWYSRDELRIPTQFEADVKIGKVFGKLIRLKSPRLIKNVIRIP